MADAARPTLGLDPVRNGSRCPVHPSHRLALVGEAPGPTQEDFAYMRLGWSRTSYLGTFARANLLEKDPGTSFPLGQARAIAPLLAQHLAPRPLLLLGTITAMAFRFPQAEVLTWADYLLDGVIVRAAQIPHPSHRNLWYNDPSNREAVRVFVEAACSEVGCTLQTSEDVATG